MKPAPLHLTAVCPICHWRLTRHSFVRFKAAGGVCDECRYEIKANTPTAVVPPGHKQCAKCEQVLALWEFHRHPLGHQAYCKLCQKKSGRKSYEKKRYGA
jgi:hypothetical protein